LDRNEVKFITPENRQVQNVIARKLRPKPQFIGDIDFWIDIWISEVREKRSILEKWI